MWILMDFVVFFALFFKIWIVWTTYRGSRAVSQSRYTIYWGRYGSILYIVFYV